MFGKSFAVFSALGVLLLTQPVYGQAVSGSINGYVYDASDAIVAGAQVTITNTGTGVSTVRAADSAGHYIATNLLPGTYSVVIEAPGFRKFVQENVVLRIDSAIRLDASISISAPLPSR